LLAWCRQFLVAQRAAVLNRQRAAFTSPVLASLSLEKITPRIPA
jgi:hypothetical protein